MAVCVGVWLTVTFDVAVRAQLPEAFVCVTLTVCAPVPVQFTVTVLPVAFDVIVPPALTVQL